MNRSSEPTFVLLVGFSIVLLIIPWILGGAFAPEEGSGGDAHAHAHHHGGGGEMTAGEFMQTALAFESDNWNESLGIVVAPDPMWHAMGGEKMSMSPVYLAAYQWGYTPAAIQLEAGVEYQFNMMALDVYHGASVSTDSGSQMIRLTPGFALETRLTFDEPGTYTLYCTYYCGKDHSSMSGSIVVV